MKFQNSPLKNKTNCFSRELFFFFFFTRICHRSAFYDLFINKKIKNSVDIFDNFSFSHFVLYCLFTIIISD